MSQHKFYTRTFQYNPQRALASQPLPSAAVKLDVLQDTDLPRVFRRIRLPFTFTFYDLPFEEVAVSPQGFFTFLPLSFLVRTSVDVFRTFVRSTAEPKTNQLAFPQAYYLPGKVSQVMIR